jgi:TolB-like protein/Tfp pilus assembly protein PilF/predicted Ser/Thr protein kinase
MYRPTGYMTAAAKVCAKCGAKIFSEAPQEFCSACLLETGLDLLGGEAVAGRDDPGHHDGLPAPHRKKAARAAKMLGDFGDYELLEEIGRGGQAVVYRARQKSLNRIVALKVIGLGHWATEAHLKRFRREAEAAASLEHPCIVPIYEVGERDGSCYFSMKFIEGGHLDAVMRREPMPARRAAELIAKVARTVHYAHEHRILHRDIKPGNILLDGKGEPHLTDFGLARLVETESTVTRTLEVLGTPSYMAPEQAVGNNATLTAAIDVYGLGAVLYQLLTGHPPFAGGTTYETIRLLLETEPRQPRLWNPKIDRDLSTICLKCLEKDPQRRYSSALALAEDVERWLKHEPIQARRIGPLARGKKWVRRNPTSALLAASLVALVAAAGWIVWNSGLMGRPITTGIAVLPFENLSDEKEHAFFADGVQDDILTKLAKIADLKVISRTSVMHYRGKQDAREIGNTLGVSHVLEGSVRRDRSRIHLNAQLIDTRTDTHVWAEEYDRDLSDVFVVQSDIAQKVAEQLHAKVSASEKLAIESKPTKDLVAYDLYTRAKDFLLRIGSNAADEGGSLLQAVDLLNQAVARDPSFFEAYCQLASANDQIYIIGFDHTSARLALAEVAVQRASRLRPDAGETHLARAENLYRGHRDYAGALAELEVARQTLPNDARLFALKALIARRQGRWEESLRNFQRAIELDPRNSATLGETALGYKSLRRYAEEKSVLDRILAFQPNDAVVRAARALVDLDATADTRPLHQVIDSTTATNPAAIRSIADAWIFCALAERDPASATNALLASDKKQIPLGWCDGIIFNRSFIEGLVARVAKDEEKARAAFAAARAEQQKMVEVQPDYAPAWVVLGLIDAALGRKDQALREGRRAVELCPVGKEPLDGSWIIKYFAMIAAWFDEKDLAFEQLAAAVYNPSSLSYGQLKLLPFWDPLRGDSRFEKILQEAKQPHPMK